MKKLILTLGLCSTLHLHAGGLSTYHVDSSWHYGFALGYTNYNELYDNNAFLGRLFISRNVTEVKNVLFGIEVGVQTGNDMRLPMRAAQYYDLGETAVQSYVGPMADVLLTTTKEFTHLTGFFKVGPAFRQMHFDRDTINTDDSTDVNSINKVNAQIQTGISFKIADKSSLSIAYQGIYAGKVGLVTINPTGTPGAGTGKINNIPTQNGLLLTITMDA